MADLPRTVLIGARSRARTACEAILREGGSPSPMTGDDQPEVCVLVCGDAGNAEGQVRTLRGRSPDVPLLVVLARREVELPASLLDAGADDVLEAPAVRAQLAPRLRALRRRVELGGAQVQPVPLVFGDLCIDFGSHRVWTAGAEVPLSPTEFQILRKLSMHVGRVVSHQEMLRAVWGEERPELFESLRVYIRGLRRKVLAEVADVSIVTRPGVGYMLAVG